MSAPRYRRVVLDAVFYASSNRIRKCTLGGRFAQCLWFPVWFALPVDVHARGSERGRNSLTSRSRNEPTDQLTFPLNPTLNGSRNVQAGYDTRRRTSPDFLAGDTFVLSFSSAWTRRVSGKRKGGITGEGGEHNAGVTRIDPRL